MPGAVICHITTRQEWQAAQQAGVYRAASLETGGFIHFSTPAQVNDVANRWFRGQEDLVILLVSVDHIVASLRYERPAGEETDDKYPHLYGPLKLDAVIDVREIACGPDGTFNLDETAVQ
jgi:uncharacterized protein (DUF952 family)